MGEVYFRGNRKSSSRRSEIKLFVINRDFLLPILEDSGQSPDSPPEEDFGASEGDTSTDGDTRRDTPNSDIGEDVLAGDADVGEDVEEDAPREDGLVPFDGEEERALHLVAVALEHLCARGDQPCTRSVGARGAPLRPDGPSAPTISSGGEGEGVKKTNSYQPQKYIKTLRVSKKRT